MTRPGLRDTPVFALLLRDMPAHDLTPRAGLSRSGRRKTKQDWGYVNFSLLPLAKIGIRPTSSEPSEDEGVPGEARLALEAILREGNLNSRTARVAAGGGAPY